MNRKASRSTASRGRAQAHRRPDTDLTGGSAADQPVSTPGKKHPIHSLVTTLPVIMLIVGLWFYYSGEKKQRGGEPVLAEMVEVTGLFSGTSEQNANPGAQRILWIKTTEKLRGGRLHLAQYKQLQQLEKEQPLQVWMAPRVQGSSTLWVLKVIADGRVLVDQLSTVR